MKTLFRLLVTCIVLIVIGAIVIGVVDNKQPVRYIRDYQIEVTRDSIYIFDNDREIGTLPNNDKSALSKLIIDDNQ